LTGEWTLESEEWVRELALRAGFDAAGVTAVAEPESEVGRVDAERFADWVDAGRAGEMEYLKRRNEAGVLLRSGVGVAMPWARSVIVCAMNYNGVGPLSIEDAPEGAGWIARYAWSGRVGDEGLLRRGAEPVDAGRGGGAGAGSAGRRAGAGDAGRGAGAGSAGRAAL